ncbi:hypothetical protein NT01EI_1421 [Edwardsiella ictaluri 93-146]|uniref:Uncharacterized protein n=1 Tax=Edwardsiella ictaluri (strain 93-146) TaxID=634503 RepID=C5BDR2_EDWI9|nr:hypothetical protein NT01EI_1421 [Edwardsiella ictaluri 93-146]
MPPRSLSALLYAMVKNDAIQQWVIYDIFANSAICIDAS